MILHLNFSCGGAAQISSATGFRLHGHARLIQGLGSLLWERIGQRHATRLGVMIDLAHLYEQGFRDVAKLMLSAPGCDACMRACDFPLDKEPHRRAARCHSRDGPQARS